MDAERWQKIERVFHAALQAEPSRRAAILEDSCAGDESLRREVESLLAHHKKAETFIETPAFATAKPSPGSKHLPSTFGGAAPFAAGTVMAQYRLLEEIGAGGMGIVYKAEDTKLGRLVALKFLPEPLAADVSALERFQHEARAASALNHPNICTIYDIEEYQGHTFIAMEYLDGRSLKDHILGRTLGRDEISRLGIQIAEALSAAHSKGVVHRDVKPGNIVVTASGPVKVLDFGLAKLIGSQGGSAPTKSLTETHSVTGTLPYMSPEQLRGREVDARTDIYAAGVVLYEMSTGRLPFTAEISPQLIDDILNSPPPLPRQVNPKISPKLEEIILKCLEKDPEDRYQTAKEIGVDLRRMTAPSSASQRLVAIRPKRFGATAGFVWAAIPILALAILMIGSGYLRTTFFNPVRSIAVLPFADESKDASSEYIGDGITEGVINRLSEIPSLRITSRTSVFRFKGKQTDALTAGKTLNVQLLLTGRIAHQADVLTLSAELVKVEDGSQIWGHQFRYSMSDLSRAQDDLAAAVSDKLQLRLNSAEGTRLTKRVTDNSEAYQLYLQARYHLNQRTGSGLRKSIEFFQQATEKDPNFALAYAGLADAYNLSNVLGLQAPRESSPEAKAAATKALVLDPRLGEAHAALGLVKSHYEYDFPAAQRDFLKALELNPNYSNAYLFYAGAYLTPMGRHQEAIAEMKKALELDPLSLPLNSLMANTYLWAGDYERSAKQFQYTIELDPNFPMVHFFYANLLAEDGKYEQAIEESQKGELLAGAGPGEAAERAAEFRRAFRDGGPEGYWQKNLEETLKQLQAAEAQYLPALDVADAYARVGNNEKTLEWLEKSYAQRDGNLTLVKSYPEFKDIRKDPRFRDLLRRIGLPD
jgi:serine/threonine protein kinase/tetratricopeptide (TPR) repeat protein